MVLGGRGGHLEAGTSPGGRGCTREGDMACTWPAPSREPSGRGYGRTWMLPATISFNGERKDWTTPRGCVQAKSTTD